MVTMNLKQAEKFFKKYGGSYFHMDREDHYKYQIYRRLRVPKEIEEHWLSELSDGEKKKSLDWIDEFEMLDAIFDD